MANRTALRSGVVIAGLTAALFGAAAPAVAAPPGGSSQGSSETGFYVEGVPDGIGVRAYGDLGGIVWVSACAAVKPDGRFCFGGTVITPAGGSSVLLLNFGDGPELSFGSS